MTISLLLSSVMLMFGISEFIGVFLYGFMFWLFLNGFYLLGLMGFKGEVFGVLGIDYISFFLIIMLIWLISLIFILFYNFFLGVLLLFMLISMFFVFISLDMIYLFICFEFSMLPMYLMIMFFGSAKERYLSILYMFIYTLLSSLPMLVVLFYVNGIMGGVGIDYMSLNYLMFDSWVYFIVLFMFLVKVPMFLVHIWLPKAHVEAPVYGSMILASVMLKMGGYGLVRCLDFMMLGDFLSDFYFCFCLTGGLFVGYICLYQVDLKVLVAYSSIVHMGMMLMGFFSGIELGYMGGVIMMVSHGICSSGMFYLVNEVYNISGSRLLMLNKGILSVYPVLIWLWLIMLINNLGVPPCFGVLGELMLIGGILSYSNLMFFFVIIFMFFVSCFVMNMYVCLVGGVLMLNIKVVTLFSYYGIIMHFIPLNFFILFIFVCF